MRQSSEIVACPNCGSKAFSLLRAAVGNVYGVKCRECDRTHELNPDVQRGV